LAFRAGFAYTTSNGHYLNRLTGERPHRFNEHTAFGRLLWEPTENFSIDIRGRWTQMNAGGIGWNALLTDEFSPAGGFLDVVYGLFPNADTVDGDNTSIPYEANIPGFSNNDRTGASVKAEYKFDGLGAATVIYAYENVKDFYG
jgi:hypothetical protein